MDTAAVIVQTDMDLSLLSLAPADSSAELMAALAVVMCLVVVALAARHSRKLGWQLAVAISAWLGLTALGAKVGFFEAPRFFVMPLVTLALFAFSRTPTARALFAATPMHWVIGLQGFRVLVELTLFALWKEGHAPEQMTFEGRNFDILVGLTAPLVAWLVSRERLSPGQIIAWNALGLSVLLNTIVTAVTSLPGPLHLDWPGAPFTALVSWPVVWLPAFLAPLAISLHVTSIRQALARRENVMPQSEGQS